MQSARSSSPGGAAAEEGPVPALAAVVTALPSPPVWGSAVSRDLDVFGGSLQTKHFVGCRAGRVLG